MTGRDVAELLGAELRGESRAIARLSDAATASADAVIVVGSAADLERAGDRDAALVVGPPDLPYGPRPHVTVDHPRLALALLAERFDRRPVTTGIAHAAHIDPTAELGPGAAVGPGAVVETGARIGAGSVVGPGAIVGPGAVLGEGCRLHANATLYDGVMLGDRVVVHAGAVIGADGFGYAASASGARKIRHLGIVKIGDDVEIGANTCIDRATLDATRIGPRTKIDNLCQIGHNVSIGADCLIAGMTGIGGSAKIGDRVTIAGYVGVADHVTIGDGATIGARSGVHKDVPAGETWIGAPAKPYRAFARSLYLQGKLDEIWQFVKDRR